MFLWILNFIVAHVAYAVPCTITFWIRVLFRQEEGLLCQVHFSLQLFFSKFQLLCIQWGRRRIALGALVSQNRFQGSCCLFLVEIGGLCSLRFFFCSQFATAVLTTSFASGVETAGPLIDTCSNEFSMSFFSLFLSRVLILLTALDPFLATNWWLVQ